MTRRETLTKTVAGGTRQLHAHIPLPASVSGGFRRLAGLLASTGTYSYRDSHGHLVDADLSDYMERIGFFGAHSAKLIRFLDVTLRPGDWVIDAGANVGLISSPMAAAVGSEGRVWAIEPLPRNVERLRRLREANNLVQLEVFPLALSSKATLERLRLSSRPGGSGSGSFVAPWARDAYTEVATTPLDTLIAERDPGIPLRLLKIDVEGFEGELLAGAMETLTTRKPLILCEFHDPLLRAAGTSSEQLLEQFGSLGYRPSPPFGRPSGSLDHQVLDLLLAPTH